MAVALAGCGSDDDDGAEPAAASSSGGANSPVSVESIDGSDVLVDSTGRTLYTAEQEKGGKILCVEGCTSFWKPAKPAGLDSAPDEVKGDLGEVDRPDGGRQLTFKDRPLYSFTDEGPGELTGDGFVDDFNGTTFEWTVASVGAGGDSSSSGSDSSDDAGGGYGY